MNLGVLWSVLFIMFVVVPLLLVWFYAIVDLFMRQDMLGVSKVLWLFAILLFPVLGSVMYYASKPAHPMPREPKPNDISETLTNLKSLHEAGVLNDTEYQEQRERLLMAS